MKKQIVSFLKWALSKFEDKPTLEDKLAAWPFPAVSEDFDPRPCKKKTKPRVAKATTRTVAKKATTVAKKTTKKAIKK
jgi:hypothetical protein